MTTTLPPSFPPRVVEHADAGRPGRSGGWRPPEHTLRGALAGAEAAIGSWLVIVVVAVAAYVATAAAPELGTAGWLDAARVGSAVWLLGHGGGLSIAGGAVDLIPLGVTLIGLVGVASATRRARLSTWWRYATAIATYTAFAGGFAAFAATPGAWRGVLGAAVVGAVGSAVAMRGRLPAGLPALVDRVPTPIRRGVAAGARAALLLLALGLAAVVVAVVLGLSRVLDVHRSLVPDAASTVILVVAQLVLLPTLVVWGASWLTGPGFAVGDGTLWSPALVDAGPLPVVPALGALPQPGSPDLGFVVVTGVLVGAAAGWWLRRRGPSDLLGSAIAAGVTAVTAAAAVGLLALLSSGGVGPGRMAVLGPDALAVGIAVLWQVGLGVGLVAVVGHPTTRDAARRAVATIRERGGA